MREGTARKPKIICSWFSATQLESNQSHLFRWSLQFSVLFGLWFIWFFSPGPWHIILGVSNRVLHFTHAIYSIYARSMSCLALIVRWSVCIYCDRIRRYFASEISLCIVQRLRTRCCLCCIVVGVLVRVAVYRVINMKC